MAVNTSRSMNAELDAGRIDGSVKKIARNRGGVVDAGTFNARDTLPEEYGVGHRGSLMAIEMNVAHGDESLPR